MSDESAIRDVIATWHRATAAGDLETVLGFISEDAVFLRAGQPAMEGREAFARSFREATGQARIVSAAEVRDVQVSGDLAYCWADLTVTMTPRDGGEPVHRRGPTLSVYRKVGDRWQLTRDANLLAKD